MLKQAVILVGGLGSRLGELTQATPKPMLSVAGKPFLSHLLEDLGRYPNFQEILLLAGYRGDKIYAHYEGKMFGRARVSVCVEPKPLGTGGALKNAESLLDNQFLLMNGDSFFDINLLDLLTPTLLPGESVRLALKRSQQGDRYGRMEISAGSVTSFLPAGSDASLPISAGIYLADISIVSQIASFPASLETDVLAPLASKGQLTGRLYDGEFIDIGIPADFGRASQFVGKWRDRPAIFFDRDGVLNIDTGYAHKPVQIEWVAGALEAIKACNDAGVLVFVVTNQAGVAKGFYSEEDVVALHDWMQSQLGSKGAHVDAFSYCPHHPEGTVQKYTYACNCRKPAAGMLNSLISYWNIVPQRAALIGDKQSDLDAAAAAGVAGHKFAKGNLLEFVRPILGRLVNA